MTDRRSYHSRPLVLMRVLILLGSTVASAPVRAESLAELLSTVATQATAPRPLRADVHIERDGSPVGDAILLARGRRVYLETRSGTRVLLSPGKTVVLRGRRVVRAVRPEVDATGGLPTLSYPDNTGRPELPPRRLVLRDGRWRPD